MCGITGVYYFNEKQHPSKEVVGKMTDVLKHRGPEGEGHYIDNNVALGHRRLKIIDLSEAGSQPMSTRDGMITITYNGEVYNFKSIRKELENLGHTFKSKTDTEVILKAYEEWGIECVNRFNGMFAFAIWDKKEKKGYLVRDRYGIKPLYYYQDKDKLLFASEVKSILTYPGMKATLDYQALDEYFTFQNIISNKTLFNGIKIIEPGSYIRFEKNKLSVKKYWDYNFELKENKENSEEKIMEVLSKLLENSTVEQMVSDVPVSAYLSSGIDSTFISTVLSKKASNVRTFSCGFDMHEINGFEKTFDELDEARKTAKLIGADNYSITVRAECMEKVMPHLVYHLEEPRLGMSFPNYLIAQLASKHNKVVFSGVGGDELFGGYVWRYNYAIGNKDSKDYLDKSYAYWKERTQKNGGKEKLFTKETLSKVGNYDTKKVFSEIFQSKRVDFNDNEQCINNAMQFEAKTFLHGLLVLEDKLNMAHSLESRVPFLDNAIVDFATKIPLKYKLGNFEELMKISSNELEELNLQYIESDKGKMILRKAMNKLIPGDIAFRKKQGFSAPLAEWIRKQGRDYIESIILSDRASNRGILNKDFVKEKLEKHINGEEDNRLLIWSLLTFEHWCRVWLDGDFLEDN